MSNYTFTLDPAFLIDLAAKIEEAAGEMRRFARDSQPISVPGRRQLEHLVTAGFWASIATEEGRTNPFTLSFQPPDEIFEHFRFQTPIPYEPESLAKLAPAVPPVRGTLCVWDDGHSGLHVWGFTRTPAKGFSLNVQAPGKLTAKIWTMTALITGHRAEFVKDVLTTDILGGLNVGDLFDSGADKSEMHAGMEKISTLWRMTSYLKILGGAMVQHGRGGTLLIISAGADDKLKSIRHAFAYAGRPYEGAKSALTDYDRGLSEHLATGIRDFTWLATSTGRAMHETLMESLKLISRLTATDGAVVMTGDFSVLAFGAKIAPVDNETAPDRILLSEPFEGAPASEIAMSEWGRGTRHHSAAQFVFDNHDSMALVASQDGTLSFLRWNSKRSMVAVTTHIEYLVD